MADVDRTTAVQAIRPQYADAILAGAKTVEFRRQPLPALVGRVLIWRIGPGGGIVGAYRVKGQIIQTARQWTDCRRDRNSFLHAAGHAAYGIADDALTDYAGGPDAVLAGILIADRAMHPAGLVSGAVLGMTRAPQSWRYAPAGWETALSLATSEAW